MPYVQFEPLAEEFCFLYLYPNGTLDNINYRFWNAQGCCNFDCDDVDDETYLLALIDAIKQQLNVDDSRVHLFGYSNGGFMAYHSVGGAYLRCGAHRAGA